MQDILQLRKVAKRIRYRIVEAALRAGNAHPASSLSMVEILISLYYGGVLETQSLLQNAPSSRDCLILSKAHGALALYALQVEMGVISEEQLWKFKKPLPEGLPGEPDPSVTISTGLATGPLGGGLALAVGRHLGALRRSCTNLPRTVVILGDGECQKGQVMEAASYAGRLKMNGLVAIVDNNGLQLDGPIEAIAMPIKNLWDATGWLTLEVDGHNVVDIVQALEHATKSDRPVALLARTVKGKGVPRMENDSAWHYYRGDRSEVLLSFLPGDRQVALKRAGIFPFAFEKPTPITPSKVALAAVRETASNDHTIVALAADLILGTGMDVLGKQFGYGSAKDRNVRLMRLPLAENLMFRLSEGFVSHKYFPVIGILEPLLSIVMLELQSLAVAAKHWDTGALILSSSPGRLSDAGPSMRSISIVQMLESIPGVFVVDPRDLEEVEDTVRHALKLRRGITVLRLPATLRNSSRGKRDSDSVYVWPLDTTTQDKRTGVGAVLVTSGWTFYAAQRFMEAKDSNRGFAIIGLSGSEDLRRLPVDRLKEIFEGRHVGTLSDTNRDWLCQTVSTVLCQNRVTVASLTALGACGIDATKFRFCEDQLGAEIDRLIGKAGMAALASP